MFQQDSIKFLSNVTPVNPTLVGTLLNPTWKLHSVSSKHEIVLPEWYTIGRFLLIRWSIASCGTKKLLHTNTPLIHPTYTTT